MAEAEPVARFHKLLRSTGERQRTAPITAAHDPRRAGGRAPTQADDKGSIDFGEPFARLEAAGERVHKPALGDGVELVASFNSALHQSAVIRKLEVVGEADGGVQRRSGPRPGIPWRDMTGID